jgi:hypothetical protein
MTAAKLTRTAGAAATTTPATNGKVSPIGDTSRGRGKKRPPVDTPLGPRRADYVEKHRMFTKSEARQATDDVKREASQLWKRLAELHDHQAHKALGYATWAVYCLAEFNVSKSQAYRMIKAAEVESLVTVSGAKLSGEEFSEAQLRELGQSDKPAEVWENATRKYGNKPTAAQLKCEVQGIECEPEPEPKPTPKPTPKPAPKPKPTPRAASPPPEPQAATSRYWPRLSEGVRDIRAMRNETAAMLEALSPEDVWRLADAIPQPGQVGEDVLIELDRAALELSFTVSYLTARLLRPDQPGSWGKAPVTRSARPTKGEAGDLDQQP